MRKLSARRHLVPVFLGILLTIAALLPPILLLGNSELNIYNGFLLTRPSDPLLQSLRKFQQNHDNNNNNKPYVEDVLCRNCRHAMAAPEMRCGSQIPPALLLPHNNNINNNNHTQAQVQDAGVHMATLYPQTCAACNPASCTKQDKVFWRYDRVGPAIEWGKTLQLINSDGVPDRILDPVQAARNITAYLVESPDRRYPKRQYFFDYNPSIVTLPDNSNNSSNSSNSSNNNPNAAAAAYLASFRVSNQHYCLHPSERKLMNGMTFPNGTKIMGRKPPPHQDWLGLALLDHDLNILSDTVVDLKAAAGGGFGNNAEDFRIFRLHQQLFITSNDLIAPLYLGMPSPPNDKESVLEIPAVFPDTTTSNNQQQQKKKKNTFGAVYVRSFASCAPCGRKRICGKNFNYFEASSSEIATSSSTTSTVRVEVWPSPPHQARTVNLTARCDRTMDPEQFVNDHDPQAPRATVEEVYFSHLEARESLLTRGRGGACCIPLLHPQTKRSLWVGVQHSKTPSQGNRRLPSNVTANHYLSRLYAFATEPPYEIVAQSAYFCLGFPSADEAPLVPITSWRKLVLGRTFECPRIHFVSGITLKAGDSSKAIIAYGINDCLARFVQVSVSNIRDMLFGTETTAVGDQL